MNEDQYLQCLHFNTIKHNSKNYNQSVPIVLSCTTQDRDNLKDKTKLCLTFNGKPIGVLNNISLFPHRKEERCARQFGLVNKGHPYQKYIFEEV